MRNGRGFNWFGKLAGGVGALGLLLAVPVFAQQPDNTKTNQQDNAKGAVTADQQAETPADREMTKKVRKALMDDKNLSTYAHNVKVISRDGKVWLRGPVNSDEEKSAIESKAAEVAGHDNVVNQLRVVPPKPSR